jgi:hypothetical protein
MHLVPYVVIDCSSEPYKSLRLLKSKLTILSLFALRMLHWEIELGNLCFMVYFVCPTLCLPGILYGPRA